MQGIKVTGNTYVSKESITAHLGDLSGQSLLSVDPTELAARLGRHPRLRAAHVRRSLDRQLAVEVEERRPVALLSAGALVEVDAEGFVWSANWGGGCVIRFDPDGKEERRIAMPATQSPSVMFGGPDFTDIYVTSANAGTGEPPGSLMPKGYDNRQHRGGELYVIKQDEVQGKPEFEADLKWPTP